jgi:hypothetical protein
MKKKKGILLFALISVLITCGLTLFLVPTIMIKMAENLLPVQEKFDAKKLSPPSDNFYKAQEYFQSASNFPFFGEKAAREASDNLVQVNTNFYLMCLQIQMDCIDSSNRVNDKEMKEISDSIVQYQKDGKSNESIQILKEKQQFIFEHRDQRQVEVFNARIKQLQLCEKWYRFFEFIRKKGIKPSYEIDHHFAEMCN